MSWNCLFDISRSLALSRLPGRQNTVTFSATRRDVWPRDTAVANAVELAEGNADLAVLLLEPADTETTELHHENLPRTIQYMDEELHKSCRTRDWRNTCIVDIRPFRSNERRMSETPEMRERQDDLAYEVARRTLNMLEPDVLLLCQSGTSSSSNKSARSLS